MRAPVTPSPGADGAPGGPRPPGLKVVTVGVVIEAVLLIGAALMVGVEMLRGASNSVAVSVFLVLFFLGLAWLLLVSVRSLRAGRRSGRAPVVVWQIMQGLVGISLLTTAGVPWAVLAGLGLLLVAAVVLVALMTRRVVEVTSG